MVKIIINAIPVCENAVSVLSRLSSVVVVIIFLVVTFYFVTISLSLISITFVNQEKLLKKEQSFPNLHSFHSNATKT